MLKAAMLKEEMHLSSCPDYWYWNSQIALTGPDVHGYSDRWADLRGRCIFPYERNRVYLNHGKEAKNRFIDVAQQVGWEEPGNSRGIALADLDNDGDLDALVTHQFAPVSIYRNLGISKSWVGLQLQGNGKTCNRDALGTTVMLDNQMREVQACNGFSAQGDRRLLFGLGGQKTSSDITANIYWCGSKNPQIVPLSPNQYHRIIQKDEGI
ncbi:MAG: CRTAC1 family protein [Heteroscytonema crispum UTEX LB 1556]